MLIHPIVSFQTKIFLVKFALPNEAAILNENQQFIGKNNQHSKIQQKKEESWGVGWQVNKV
ncbi:AAEL002697-PA [Aedes aegypti]|uniref:AAEL002697-PA n=1 Tax=Aedes aegypti TaxID=7159 RepID=Q17HG9_AEDAE|nr:AAEL002697-PA [Aedes aegypti]